MGYRYRLLRQALPLLCLSAWLCCVFLGNSDTKMDRRVRTSTPDNRQEIPFAPQCQLLSLDLNDLQLPFSLGLCTLGARALCYEEAKQTHEQDRCNVLWTTAPDYVPNLHLETNSIHLNEQCFRWFQPPGKEFPSLFMLAELLLHKADTGSPSWALLKLKICEQINYSLCFKSLSLVWLIVQR